MEQKTLELGIIGMGDMGRLYANKLHAAGWENVIVCDRPENYERLSADFKGTCCAHPRFGHHRCS